MCAWSKRTVLLIDLPPGLAICGFDKTVAGSLFIRSWRPPLRLGLLCDDKPFRPYRLFSNAETVASLRIGTPRT